MFDQQKQAETVNIVFWQKPWCLDGLKPPNRWRGSWRWTARGDRTGWVFYQPRWSQVVQDGWNIHHLYHCTSHNPCAKLAHSVWECMNWCLRNCTLAHPWPSVLTAVWTWAKCLKSFILHHFDKFHHFDIFWPLEICCISVSFFRAFLVHFFVPGWPSYRPQEFVEEGQGWSLVVKDQRRDRTIDTCETDGLNSPQAFRAFWAWWGSLHLWPFAWNMSDKIYKMI